jgi:hypothetical protein
MNEFFLIQLFHHNYTDSARGFSDYILWTDDIKLTYKVPTSLNKIIIEPQFSDAYESANALISDLYFRDSELLFLAVYTQRIAFSSCLEPACSYYLDYEYPSFSLTDEEDDHCYLSNVDIFLIKTKNKIFAFEDSKDERCAFQNVVVTKENGNISSKLIQRVFDLYKIKYKRNYNTLYYLVERFYM